MVVFAADYPFLNIFWTMIIFCAWVIWVWMMIGILTDVFRRRDLSGWGKAGWSTSRSSTRLKAKAIAAV